MFFFYLNCSNAERQNKTTCKFYQFSWYIKMTFSSLQIKWRSSKGVYSSRVSRFGRNYYFLARFGLHPQCINRELFKITILMRSTDFWIITFYQVDHFNATSKKIKCKDLKIHPTFKPRIWHITPTDISIIVINDVILHNERER